MLKLFTITAALMLTFLLLSTAFAVSKKQPAKIKPDTSKVQVKIFNAQAIAKFKADKDFKYNGNSPDRISVWEVFWNWLWNAISNFFNRIPFGGTIVKYFFLALAAALLIFVIFKSLGIDAIRILRGEAQKINVPYSESLENIHEINFDDEIEKAAAQHNYRLAVRLQYLKCLKQLSDNNLIHWQIDKTNAAYLYELKDPEQKHIFGLLTRQFEYAWYGNFLIDKQAFNSINELFQNFKNRLP
ncbi:MAG: hypothetical protein JWR12_2538 [Mucilaginibacter sp.]|nr:hypothetical protein [Mucilaginibacter sp.]